MESNALATDPFEVAMQNLADAGISFEIVENDPDPPDKTEPPPGEEGRFIAKRSEASSQKTVTEPSDTSRRVPLSDYLATLRHAADLTPTEHHVALAVAAHMAFKDRDRRHVPEAHCWPSPELIATETHRSRSVVYETLSSLEAKGYIFRERRGGSATSLIWATVPDGGAVIRLSEVRPTGQRSPAHRTQKL